MKARSAFTLVEMLVVISILAVIGATIGACLFAGIRVLDRAKHFSRVDVRNYTAFAMFEKDMANTMRSRVFPFRGDPQEVTFSLMVPVQNAETGEVAYVPGASRYRFSRDRRQLQRRQWAFPGDEPSGDLGWETVLAGARLVTFEYCGDPEGGVSVSDWGLGWSSETNLPVAVRMRVRMGEEDERTGERIKTVVVQAGDRSGRP